MLTIELLLTHMPQKMLSRFSQHLCYKTLHYTRDIFGYRIGFLFCTYEDMNAFQLLGNFMYSYSVLCSDIVPFLRTLLTLKSLLFLVLSLELKVGQEIQALGRNLFDRSVMGPKLEWHTWWRGSKCGRKWKSFARMALQRFSFLLEFPSRTQIGIFCTFTCFHFNNPN